MSLDKDKLVEFYRKMITIRKFEEKVSTLFQAGKIPGDVHLCIGQEATFVGICENLEKKDLISLDHRGHAGVYAKGADLKGMMAELFGKKTGYCKGRGGSIHLAATEFGILGANGIVGGSIGIATGGGMACVLKRNKAVSVGFFGDGAANRGTFHESINLASIWNLPVVYVCVNNFFAMSSYQRDAMNIDKISSRADSYGIPGVTIDGNDVLAVFEAGKESVARAREGKGPSLIEAITWRHHGHFEGENDIYRDPKEHEAWLEKDPVKNFRLYILKKNYLSEVRLVEMENRVDKEVEESVEYAEKSPYPDVSELLENVYK